MRILHVTHQYWPAMGGAEQYITDLSEEMARRGHQVDVFTSRSADYRTWQSTLPSAEVRNGVRIRRFTSLVRGALGWKMLEYGLGNYLQRPSRRYEPFIFFGNGPVCPGMFASMFKEAARYDLVHINNLHYAHAFVAHLAARCRGLPVLITPHVHVDQPVTFDVGYLRDILRGCSAIFADTRAEKQFLRSFNMNVVQAGVGMRLDRFPSLAALECRKRFGIPQDAFVILFLGRKTEYKGLDISLEAFLALRRTRSHAYLLAVGPETEFSQQLWSRYGPMDGLVVRGAVSDEERLAALAACDVLVLPSAAEAFGIVYLEAWAYEKPVIGARIPAVSSLIQDGKVGLLVEPDHPEALVAALVFLEEHRQKAYEMGRQGRRLLERRYTTERIGDIVEGTYARVLRRHNTTRMQED